MATFRRSGLAMRMENIEGAVAAENYDPAESLVVEEEAAAAVGEADMVAEEVDGLTSDIDASQDAAEELVGEVIPAMEEAATDDGMTPREAEHVQARLESICRRAGIDFASTGLTMRRESFSGSASRKTQTKMRLEAADGVFQRIWENIKKAWLWLKDQISGIYSKWTSSAEGVKKRLEDIQTRMTAMKAGSDPDARSLKTSAKIFSIDGKTNVLAGNDNTLIKVCDSTLAFFSSITPVKSAIEGLNIASITEALIGKKGEKIGNATLKKDDILDFSKGVITAISTGANSRSSGLLKEFENPGPKNTNDILAVSGCLPGGRSVVHTAKKLSGGDLELESIKVSVEIVEDRFADSYDAPGVKDITTVINKGLNICSELLKSDKKKAESDVAIKAALDKFDALIKEAKAVQDRRRGMSSDDAAAEAKNTDKINATSIVLQLSGSVQSAVDVVTTKAPKMLFDCAAACADIAAASVNNLKEPKK